MIGGAPTTRAWADEIGADGYAEDAIEAVTAAKKLLGVA
jgi:methanogenic corrinoid protein MtbC1